MGLIEKIFISFFHYKSLKTIDHKGLGQFASIGLDWQDLSWELLDIAILHIKYISCEPNGFIRKNSKFFPSYKSIGALCFPLPDKYLHEILSHLAN